MNYEKQGNNFLIKNGITFKTTFIDYKPYFADDKESRDVFKITFKRKRWTKNNSGKQRLSFSLQFGQSLNNSTMNGENPPTVYDVLACLTKYEPGTFENFCADFGYDTDSRKAESIYKEVLKEWEKVSSFFSDKEMEEIKKIQ